MSAAFRLDPAREQSISGGEELDEERRQTGGPSIKHRIQARFDVVARRPRPRQPDDPAIRRREQQHFGAVEALPLPAPRRVASVDALRGFTMFWIIGADVAAKALAEMLFGKGTIASTAGNIIGGQFEHAEWEGLRFYDLIFPLFIFVTGVAIVFSLTRLVEQESKFAAHWRVLRRSLLLFALGLVYYGGVSESWPDIRLLGVLNRIALCYLFTSLLFLNLRLPGLIVAFVAILAGYWALMTFVSVSGIGVGPTQRTRTSPTGSTRNTCPGGNGTAPGIPKVCSVRCPQSPPVCSACSPACC